ncbi:iron ABC transporter permease [Bacteroidales bacterium OttesenSCG-928-J19]|nr:iron ABC transporter permease [Bacteroidales bacterium OttesenSCG-928-J19]
MTKALHSSGTRSQQVICLGLILLIILLFFCNLFCGSVSIPPSAVIDVLLGNEVERSAWRSIVLQSRLPQAVTAILSGAALAVSGLMLQTLFRNPLAGPSILGITGGANLGVALVMLSLGGMAGISSFGVNFSVVIVAFLGASGVLALILYFSRKVKSNVLVLIIGMMIGYLASSVISILNSVAEADSIRSYVIWGLGSFSNVSSAQLGFYGMAVLIGLFFSILLIKPLNILLLGDRYAANLGVNLTRIRAQIFLCSGFLSALVTAFCGPVGFIGLAVPHVARMILGTSNQQLLMPATILSGAAIALICNLMTLVPFGNTLLPLNAVTPLLGAPIIIYVIVSKRNSTYFN